MGEQQLVPTKPPVYSIFANDPDFSELLEMFVETLGERRKSLATSYEIKDYEKLKSEAHQLKGAGGGYGFPELTTVSAQLEEACKSQNIDRIGETLNAALSYIDRVSL